MIFWNIKNVVRIVLYGQVISQSDCRKAGPYQLPSNKNQERIFGNSSYQSVITGVTATQSTAVHNYPKMKFLSEIFDVFVAWTTIARWPNIFVAHLGLTFFSSKCLNP